MCSHQEIYLKFHKIHNNPMRLYFYQIKMNDLLFHFVIIILMIPLSLIQYYYHSNIFQILFSFVDFLIYSVFHNKFEMLLNKYLYIPFYYKRNVGREIFSKHNFLLDYLITWGNKIFR